jgi:hypothetical protein
MMAPMSARSTPQDADEGAAASAAAVGMGGAGTGPLAVTITGEDWLDAICPFLRARDGSWRSASPVREHRCWASDPPSELPVLTQQRLCLVRAHDGCERFLHARELRSASLARDRVASVDTPPAGIPAHGAGGRRASAPGDAARGVAASILRLPGIVLAALGGSLMVAAVVVVLLLNGGAAGDGRGDPSVQPSVPGALRTREPALPDPSVSPDGFRRYRVREGDTLRTIADRFGVSVRQLRQVNELGDPPHLAAGDVIVIPPAD